PEGSFRRWQKWRFGRRKQRPGINRIGRGNRGQRGPRAIVGRPIAPARSWSADRRRRGRARWGGGFDRLGPKREAGTSPRRRQPAWWRRFFSGTAAGFGRGGRSRSF